MSSAVTNDIFTKEDGEFLTKHEALKHWRGAVELEAPGRGARLEIDHGKVTVASLQLETASPRPATLRLTGEFPAIERVVLGIRSAFEEILQLEVAAQPIVNEATKELLETLFPRLVADVSA